MTRSAEASKRWDGDPKRRVTQKAPSREVCSYLESDVDGPVEFEHRYSLPSMQEVISITIYDRALGSWVQN